MHENESLKDDVVNGRTANISIPGDVMMSPSKSPKSPSQSQTTMVEKRNSMRQQEVGGAREKEHMNGAKVGNHYNNNSKVNSVCLNNLILPLLSEVSHATFLNFLSLLSLLISYLYGGFNNNCCC